MSEIGNETSKAAKVKPMTTEELLAYGALVNRAKAIGDETAIRMLGTVFDRLYDGEADE